MMQIITTESETKIDRSKKRKKANLVATGHPRTVQEHIKMHHHLLAWGPKYKCPHFNIFRYFMSKPFPYFMG